MKRQIQITSGRGPSECERAVAKVMEKILEDAARAGVEIKITDTTLGREKNSFASVTLALTGPDNQALDKWKGTIKWIAYSPFRPAHKRKNWFVKITEMETEQLEQYAIAEKDLQIETFRSSGPGGQNVNKVATGVRITHIPSGIVATAREERSQYANKRSAIRKIKEQIATLAQAKDAEAEQKKWGQHNDLERGRADLVITEPL